MVKILNFLSKIIRSKYAMTGVPAIIINSKGEILLGKREDSHIFYPSLWGLPGGMIEYNETLEDGIKRELKEEIGVNSKIIKKAKGDYEHLPNKECPLHTVDIPYYCKIIGIPKPRDETSEVRWFKPSDIKKMKLAYLHKQILEGEKLI